MIRTTHRRTKIACGFLLALGVLGAVFYPILIVPFFDPEKYKRIQRDTRRNIKRENIQPGNMNIWRNPFDPVPITKEEQK